MALETPTPGARWDMRALRAGGGVALMFAIPFAVVARILTDGGAAGNKHSSWSAPLFLASLLGFFFGAAVAAWHQNRDTPLTHAIVAASGTYVIVQTIIIVANIILERQVRWLSIIFTLTVVTAVGLFGGLIGRAMRQSGLEPKQ